MPPGRDGYATTSREHFIAAWRTGSGRGSGVGGAQPFYQFSLAARLREPSAEQLLEAVMKRAGEVMQRRSLSGAPAGVAAWEAAGAWLERCADPADPAARVTAASWSQGSLRPYLTMAETVTPLLQEAEESMVALENATARHVELLEEAELVARKIEEATAAGDEAKTKWQAAEAQASYVAALHERLAGQIAEAAGD
jgi:hypothetical protein